MMAAPSLEQVQPNYGPYGDVLSVSGDPDPSSETDPGYREFYIDLQSQFTDGGGNATQYSCDVLGNPLQQVYAGKQYGIPARMRIMICSPVLTSIGRSSEGDAGWQWE